MSLSGPRKGNCTRPLKSLEEALIFVSSCTYFTQFCVEYICQCSDGCTSFHQSFSYNKNMNFSKMKRRWKEIKSTYLFELHQKTFVYPDLHCLLPIKAPLFTSRHVPESNFKLFKNFKAKNFFRLVLKVIPSQ